LSGLVDYQRLSLCADNASGTDADGQQSRGYSGPTTATVEPTPLSPTHGGSRGRLYHVTVTETPSGRRADHRASDVTDNDVNDRRCLDTLQVPATPYSRDRKCADTIGTVLVPWVGHFRC